MNTPVCPENFNRGGDVNSNSTFKCVAGIVSKTYIRGFTGRSGEDITILL